MKTINWLKISNIVIFQWLFIRLTLCNEKRIENYKLDGFDLMPDGSVASRGRGEVKTHQWYSFQLWILPLSGWINGFVYLNKKPKFIKLTK